MDEGKAYFAKKKSEKDEMVELLRTRFGELFLASNYASQEDRKSALYKLMKEGEKYTVKELQEMFTEAYSIPISRVSINTYINQLDAEEKVVTVRRGLGGTKEITIIKPLTA